MTVFRRLREVHYRTSFTHRGQYYTLAELPQFDEWGLWFHGDIGFSRSGTLKETIAVQVEQAPDGRTHGKLSLLLGVRVHNPLLELVHEGRIGRERYRGQHLYVSAGADPAQREPVEITRRGRPVAYVVWEDDLRDLGDVRRRREEAVQWYASYRRATSASPEAAALTDEDVDRLVHELR